VRIDSPGPQDTALAFPSPRTVAGCLALALLSLAACSRGEDEPVALFRQALSDLGVSSLTFERAFHDEDTVRLANVRGRLGSGAVEMGEVLAVGMAKQGRGWTARVISARNVTGDLSADTVLLEAPHATSSSDAGYARASATGYRGRPAGYPVRADALSLAPAADATTIAFTNLLADLPGEAPAPLRALTAGIAWSGTLSHRADARGAATFDLRELRSDLGTVSGTATLMGPDEKPVSAAAILGGLVNPPFSPGVEGLRLVEAAVRPNLSGSAVSAIAPWVSGLVAGPGLKGLSAVVAPMLAQGRIAGAFGLRPRPALAISDLPSAAKANGAETTLGVTLGGMPLLSDMAGRDPGVGGPPRAP
jgi:hypothetical protein